MKMPITERVSRFFGIQMMVRYVSTAAMIHNWPGNRLSSMSKTSIPIVSHSYAVQNHAIAVSAIASFGTFTGASASCFFSSSMPCIIPKFPVVT